MLIEISENLRNLSKKLPELYIVGGYVRNRLLEIDDSDIDICGPMTIEELEKLLADTKYSVKVKSKSLGSAMITCGEESYEYTTFRKDTYAEGGNHLPVKVKFVTDISQDAKRRDFTCNALYYDIKNDRILDFYNGVDDIKNRILRTVETPDEVLSHDGLRILRLFRFQCELNFKIQKETLNAAFKYKKNLRDISGERVLFEITSILHSPSKYKKLSKPNSYMKALNNFNKGAIWPIFGIDCAKIKFKMVKKVEHKSQGFLIDVIDTVHPISISYYLNLILTYSFKLNKKMVEQYIKILSGYYEALNKLENKPYFFKYFDVFPSVCQLLSQKSKYLANKYEFFYKYIIAHKLIVSIKDLAISGDDLKKYYPTVKPERYRSILESLLSDIFDGRIDNEKSQLVKAVEGKLKYL